MAPELRRLHDRLIKVKDSVTISMILEARKKRNWSVYDKLSENEKLRLQIAELNTLITSPKYTNFRLKNR